MMLAPALAAARVLRSAGIATVVLNIPVIKPLDTTTVLAAATATQTVITAENHTIIGGLGSAVAETLAESALPRPLHRIGLTDTFAEGARTAPYLFQQIRPDHPAPNRYRLVRTAPARHSPSLPTPPSRRRRVRPGMNRPPRRGGWAAREVCRGRPAGRGPASAGLRGWSAGWADCRAGLLAKPK